MFTKSSTKLCWPNRSPNSFHQIVHHQFLLTISLSKFGSANRSWNLVHRMVLELLFTKLLTIFGHPKTLNNNLCSLKISAEQTFVTQNPFCYSKMLETNLWAPKTIAEQTLVTQIICRTIFGHSQNFCGTHFKHSKTLQMNFWAP